MTGKSRELRNGSNRIGKLVIRTGSLHRRWPFLHFPRATSDRVSPMVLGTSAPKIGLRTIFWGYNDRRVLLAGSVSIPNSKENFEMPKANWLRSVVLVILGAILGGMFVASWEHSTAVAQQNNPP